MKATVDIGPLEVEPAQRKRWCQGPALAEKWRNDFPQLFDDDDLSLVLNQPRLHFYEWLAAIVLHHATGYRSLVEKYQYKPKRETTERILPANVLACLDDETEFGKTQGPDLLMYAPDRPGDWFFCEVKGPKDKFQDDRRQEGKLEALAAASGKPVRVLWMEWAKS